MQIHWKKVITHVSEDLQISSDKSDESDEADEE